jgi:hypothetical protein
MKPRDRWLVGLGVVAVWVGIAGARTPVRTIEFYLGYPILFVAMLVALGGLVGALAGSRTATRTLVVAAAVTLLCLPVLHLVNPDHLLATALRNSDGQAGVAFEDFVSVWLPRVLLAGAVVGTLGGISTLFICGEVNRRRQAHRASDHADDLDQAF